MQFRQDINGMRAIAVLAVVAFHFGFAALSGGFVGVDIFFVISGFLMTGIVVARHEAGTFSLPGFYLDRGRRIIPPLAVLVAVLLAGGTAWLLPQALLVLGKQAASAMLFVSNMLFWREAGYFDTDSETKWLLHTWSLSVEWQFYILYPLIVVPLLRIGGRRLLLAGLGVLFVASLLLSVRLSVTQPSAAFFLLPTRAWEMLAGGLVFLLPSLPSRIARAGQVAGLALIAVALFVARAEGWPGWLATVPVLGSALLIAADRRTSRVTGNPVVTWIGLRSYSIYLWHWPVAVLLVTNDRLADPRLALAGCAVSLLLGHGSYQWVERFGKRGGKRPHIHVATRWASLRSHAAIALLVVAVAIGGGALWAMRGLPMRFSPEVRALDQDIQPGGPFSKACFSVVRGVPEPCLVRVEPGKPTRAALTLIGDSHSEAAAGGVAAALARAVPGGGLAFNGYASCLPVLGAGSPDPENQCAAFNARFLEPQTRPRTTPLLLIGHWQGAIDRRSVSFDGTRTPATPEVLRRRIIESSCRLAKAGPTWILLPTPSFDRPVATAFQVNLARDPATPDIRQPLATYLGQNRQSRAILAEAAQRCGVRLLDPVPLLCSGGACFGTRDRRAVIRDEDHLTEYGSRFLIPLYARIWQR